MLHRGRSLRGIAQSYNRRDAAAGAHPLRSPLRPVAGERRHAECISILRHSPRDDWPININLIFYCLGLKMRESVSAVNQFRPSVLVVVRTSGKKMVALRVSDSLALIIC
jgi:hypothetical protein